VHSQQLGEHAGLPQNRYRSRVSQARIEAATGDLPAALALLEEAERVYVSDFFPNVRPIPALRARLQAAHGQLNQALTWVRSSGLSLDDDVFYMREFEHVTLATVLLAGNANGSDRTELVRVDEFLLRLADVAQVGGRFGSLIEIRVLQSICAQALGDDARALDALGHALTLAEREGHVRVFRDAGAALISLLKQLPGDSAHAPLVTDLLPKVTDAEPSEASSQALPDPLSDRELDVLRLLGTDLDGPDIARQLFISLNTLRTHTQRIYTKLGVNNRRAAVRRAAEVGLLPKSR
jgi:LuxR family maltose regulon positive regulatory protein